MFKITSGKIDLWWHSIKTKIRSLKTSLKERTIKKRIIIIAIETYGEYDSLWNKAANQVK